MCLNLFIKLSSWYLKRFFLNLPPCVFREGVGRMGPDLLLVLVECCPQPLKNPVYAPAYIFVYLYLSFTAKAAV